MKIPFEDLKYFSAIGCPFGPTEKDKFIVFPFYELNTKLPEYVPVCEGMNPSHDVTGRIT